MIIAVNFPISAIGKKKPEELERIGLGKKKPEEEALVFFFFQLLKLENLLQ